MDSKSPLPASIVMLVVAVFVLGGLAGYIAGTNHVAQRLAVAAPGAMPAGGGCGMGKGPGQGSPSCSMVEASTGKASACPMAAGKDKAAAVCPKGGEKGECASHANCPDAGKCPTPGAKLGATCPMSGDKAASAKSAACPMGGAEGACADRAQCPDAGKCPVTPAAKAPAQGAAAAKAVYGCSMCPDVKSDKPGKCPKCGMALEKK